MCGGPSDTQMELQTEEANFLATQVSAYNTAYKNFSTIQDTLNKQFDPILKAGPGQRGFTDAERTDLNTQATQGTARNYAHAKQALQNDIATEGGGTSNINLTSGASDQYREELASTAAGSESDQQLQLEEADYALGRQNYEGAVQGEEALAAGWNPNSFGNTANNSAGVANSEANTVASEQNSLWNGVLGALGGIASNVTYGAGKGFGLG